MGIFAPGIAAYAPWSPQELFDLTVLAFNVADRFRIPVMVMSDEVVGHMVERVVIPPEDQIPRWERKRPKVASGDGSLPYLAEDDDLVPPLAHAGEGYRVHLTGLTHDERGYPDMSADVHHRLVTRLVEKVRRNADAMIRYDSYKVDDAKIVVISYGCTARSARRAVAEARAQGIPAGLLRLISLWPFPVQILQQVARQAEAFIVAEMNLGQMICEVERHVAQPVIGVNHAGGTMMPPDPILRAMKEVSTHGAGTARRKASVG
ncbi:MAG: transketolase C-terminal domain-containing protein [Armatimonadota bacterium]